MDVDRRVSSTPLRLIVEGPNNGGKSTALQILKRLMPGSTVLELHDTGHVHVLRQAALLKAQLVKLEDWRALSEKTIADCVSYLDMREDSCVTVLNRLSMDDVIVERLLLTTYVYKRLLFDRDGLPTMRARLRNLTTLRTHLMLLTADADRLAERARANGLEKARAVVKETPEHLTDPRIVRRKAQLYDAAFEQLDGLARSRIDTSDMQSEQLAGALAELLSRIYSNKREA